MWGGVGWVGGVGWGWGRGGREGEGERGGRETDILDVGFADEAFFRDVEVYSQQAAHGFHEGDALVWCEGALLEVLDEGVGVEVVDVGGRLEVGRFVFVALAGWVGLELQDSVEGVG